MPSWSFRPVWRRCRLPLAVVLISAFTFHLVAYPFYGEHFARLGDQSATHALQQWHRWRPFAIGGLLGAVMIIYSTRRENDDRSPVLLAVMTATFVLAVFLLELLLLALTAYVWSTVHHR